MLSKASNQIFFHIERFIYTHLNPFDFLSRELLMFKKSKAKTSNVCLQNKYINNGKYVMHDAFESLFFVNAWGGGEWGMNECESIH